SICRSTDAASHPRLLTISRSSYFYNPPADRLIVHEKTLLSRSGLGLAVNSYIRGLECRAGAERCVRHALAARERHRAVRLDPIHDHRRVNAHAQQFTQRIAIELRIETQRAVRREGEPRLFEVEA